MPLNPPAGAALAVCIVVTSLGGRRTIPVVRTTSLATAYLGALCDAAGRAFDWVELWFPHDEPAQSGGAAGEIRDGIAPMARWRDLIRRWENSPTSGYMNMGWESGLPRPLVLQTETLSWLPFADPKTGRELQFCRDDAQLGQAGLPFYSSNTAVFLTADGSTFFQATGSLHDKPTNRLEELFPKNKSLSVISTGGRSLAVRRVAPLALGDYADIVAGTSLNLPEERKAVHSSARRSADASNFLSQPHRSLLRSRAGRKEWMAEILALKMRLLGQAIRTVREGIAVTREPFLSLSEHAFAVRFGPAGPPFELWDFEVVLHATSCAAIRAGAGPNIAWRAMNESQMPPAYQSRSVGRQLEREVECRLRLVTRQENNVVVEATLGRCDETNAAGMLACVHLPLSTGRRVLWGRLSRDNSLARDEIRFRSFPTDLDERSAIELERVSGFVWSNVFLELLPAAGYGDDFHSLGVLATRLLLTSEARQLPSVLDTVFSVLERLREQPAAGDLPAQIRGAFDREPRFRELLHPGRGVAFPISRDEAMASLGEAEWWDLLSFVLRLFPTELNTAFCRSEQATNLDVFPRAFDEAVGVADALSRRLTERIMPPEALNNRVRSITDSIRRSSAK